MKSRNWLFGIVATISVAAPLSAAAQGELVLYCTVQEEWCRPMVTGFEKATAFQPRTESTPAMPGRFAMAPQPAIRPSTTVVNAATLPTLRREERFKGQVLGRGFRGKRVKHSLRPS